MIQVDLESPVPLEEQIRRCIREAIAIGEVGGGEELPSVRQVASDLGIHFNTVARAYRRLRDEGLLRIGRGRGVRVRTLSAPDAESPDLLRRVRERVREALTEGRLGGLSLEKIEALMKDNVRAWGEKESRQ